MRAAVVSRCLVPMLLLSAFSLLLSPVYSASSRPVLSSMWTSTPPIVDGVFSAGEWPSPQITMQEPTYPINAFAYFVNDASNLYVMVDAVGDDDDDVGDLCYLVFDFGLRREISISGQSGTKYADSYSAAIGFGSSPNGANNHKIYEFRIPLSYINAKPGGSVDFCSPYHGKPSIVYDSSGGRDNEWPPGVGDASDVNKWGMMHLGTRVVGGVSISVNKFVVASPYFVLAALLATAFSIAAISVKHKRAT